MIVSQETHESRQKTNLNKYLSKLNKRGKVNHTNYRKPALNFYTSIFQGVSYGSLFHCTVKMVKSLLEQLEDHINVDCDSLDPSFIKSLPIRCHDQTSNQRIVHEAITDPTNAYITKAVVEELKGQPWDDVYVTAVGAPSANVFSFLRVFN